MRSTQDLAQQGIISESEKNSLAEVEKEFSISITPEMAAAMDPEDPQDPIRRQFVPSTEELNVISEELSDPIGDNRFSPVKGVVHRYPDRCLLLPMTVCPVYCRFCFRREKVGQGQNGLSRRELSAALDYIRETKEIWEVILTGGDPLFMSSKLLGDIVSQLAAIDHVEVLRIHTRVPVVDPSRINDALISALKVEKPVYVVLHSNHPKELTPAALQACKKLADHGLPMLSQTVLLKGINDDVETLGALMRAFVRNRIKPYYLHQGDFAKGTGHFRTSIQEGQELLRQLRGRYSGLCQPTYVLDIPGGYGKVPINHCYLRALEDGRYEVEDYLGREHSYPL